MKIINLGKSPAVGKSHGSNFTTSALATQIVATTTAKTNNLFIFLFFEFIPPSVNNLLSLSTDNYSRFEKRKLAAERSAPMPRTRPLVENTFFKLILLNLK